jgi:hypothetical protein
VLEGDLPCPPAEDSHGETRLSNDPRAQPSTGRLLEGLDEENFRELASATGWDEVGLREELARLGEDPSESVERYRGLFEKYSREAVELFSRGDTRQAAEKMWGAVLALVKLYAAVKGVFVAHWSRSKVDSVIASNVEPEYRKLFRELVDRVHVLHEHFYEGSLNEELFRERWEEVLELLEKAKEVVYERLPRQAPWSRGDSAGSSRGFRVAVKLHARLYSVNDGGSRVPSSCP